MTNEILDFISSEMEKMKINYELEEWRGKTVPGTYWIGEYNENGTAEDYADETTFILTGYTRESRLILEIQKEQIKQHFYKTVTNIFKNGNGVAITYSLSRLLPTGTENMHRTQINLSVKEWSE